MAIYKCAGRKRHHPDGEPYCTHEAPARWTGPCPACGRLYDCERVGVDKGHGHTTMASLFTAKPKPRISTNYPEIDKVLGGGLPKGGSVIISGPPGVGKTTLLSTIADRVAQGKHVVTYASGEQSIDDFAEYAQRLGVNNSNIVVFGNEGDIYKITDEAEKNRSVLLIIDSLQTAACDDVKASEGTAEQCREVANYVTAWGKRTGVAIVLVSHVNKDGQLAGAKSIEHLVDGTLELDPAPEFDADGELKEETRNYRTLTSGAKFRLGESGVSQLFDLTREGLKPVRKRSRLELVTD